MLHDWEKLSPCKIVFVEDVRFVSGQTIAIRTTLGFSLLIPTDLCDIPPKIGESVELISHLGQHVGRTIHGIRIGGRIYRCPPDGCDWADPNYPFEFNGAL